MRLNLLLLLSALLTGLTGAGAFERQAERSQAQHRAATVASAGVCDAACAAVQSRRSAVLVEPTDPAASPMPWPVTPEPRSPITPLGERREE
ncbi:MAG TPA: hypothetical protein VF628_14270 [Allosphingosinicella sp.]|jgi:hypothetical protein